MLYRIITKINDKIILYELNNKYNLELLVSEIDSFINYHNEQILSFCDDPYESLRNRELDPKYLKIINDKYNIIKDIIDNEDYLIDKNKLLNEIDNICEQKNIKQYYVIRILSTWWERGQTKNSLLPNYGKNVGKDYNYSNKPGKKSNITNNVPAINSELKILFDKIIKKKMFKEKLGLYKAYESLLVEYLNDNEHSENTAPTFYQFKNYYYINYTQKERNEGISSQIEYNKDIRPLVGNAYTIAQGPGNIYELDSTPADVYLVSQYDRSKVIGKRPTLYSVTDIYSGMITGVSVTYDPAQYIAAADALYNSIIDKVTLCKKYNFNISEDQWPCCGIPQTLMVDNAEFLCDKIERFTSIYPMIINNAASFRPDQKGCVEKSLHLLMEALNGYLLAVPDQRKLKKEGSVDVRPKAALTIKEFTNMILQAAIYVNGHIRDAAPVGFPFNEAKTSINIWNYGFRTGKSFLVNSNNYTNISFALLKRVKASFSENGIYAEGIRWICSEAIFQGWLDRNKQNKRPKNMELVLDPADISTAFLIPDPKNNPLKYWECQLAPSSSRYLGMSLYEARQFIEQESQIESQEKRKRFIHKAKLNKNLDEIVENAKRSKPQVEMPSKEKFNQEVKENYKEERICQSKDNVRFEHNIKTENTNNNEILNKDNNQYDGSFPDDVNLL